MKKILASLLAVVVLLAVMVTPVMAADDTGSTTISGDVQVTIEVTAPDNITSITLSPLSPYESGTQTATVKSNKANWTLEVAESGGDGCMSGTPGTLTNAMEIQGGDLGTTYTALSGTGVELEDGGDSVVGTTNISDIKFRQAVEWGDAAGSYSITLTFTATAAP